MSADKTQAVVAKEYFSNAQKLQAEGQIAEAIACYRKTLELQPDWSWVHHALGDSLVRQGKLEEAIVCYRKATELQPDLPWSYHSLASTLVQQGKLEEAVASYRKAIELKPDLTASYHSLGGVLERQNKFEDASDCYRKAIEIAPNQIATYTPLVRVLFKLGKAEEAIRYYCQGIELNPDDLQLHFTLACGCFDRGHIDKAFDGYLKCIQLDPTHLNSYLRLQHIPMNQSRLDKAITCLREVIDKQPSSPYAHSALARALTKQGDIDAAIMSLKIASRQQVIKLRPDLSTIDWNTAQSRAPDFMVIGSAKAGTTSLYDYLVQHPLVLPSVEKELHFFSAAYGSNINRYTNAIDLYLAHFPPVPSEAKFITGEATPNYLDYCSIPGKYFDIEKQVFKHFPNVKLIVILRNPVSRTYSAYNHGVTYARERRAFRDAIEFEFEILNSIQTPLNLLDVKLQEYPAFYLINSMYFYFLKKWMDIFPKEQFLILKFEQLCSEPFQTMTKVFDFLNLPSHSLSSYKKRTRK